MPGAESDNEESRRGEILHLDKTVYQYWGTLSLHRILQPRQHPGNNDNTLLGWLLEASESGGSYHMKQKYRNSYKRCWKEGSKGQRWGHTRRILCKAPGDSVTCVIPEDTWLTRDEVYTDEREATSLRSSVSLVTHPRTAQKLASFLVSDNSKGTFSQGAPSLSAEQWGTLRPLFGCAFVNPLVFTINFLQISASDLFSEKSNLWSTP